MTVSVVTIVAPAYLILSVTKLLPSVKIVASGFGQGSSVRSGRVQVTFSRISRQLCMGCLGSSSGSRVAGLRAAVFRD